MRLCKQGEAGSPVANTAVAAVGVNTGRILITVGGAADALVDVDVALGALKPA